MAPNAFLSRLGIEHPILLAPMAGSGGTPELAAAVSNAGGQRAWGGAYANPDEIAAAIRRIRQLTSRPFSDRKVDPQPMLDIMRQAHARLGLPPPVLPPVPANPFDEQFAVVLEERPPVFSFTFGMPSSEQIAMLKNAASPSAARRRPWTRRAAWRKPASTRSSPKARRRAPIAAASPRRSKIR
jgi:nitronate monooxygenase